MFNIEQRGGERGRRARKCVGEAGGRREEILPVVPYMKGEMIERVRGSKGYLALLLIRKKTLIRKIPIPRNTMREIKSNRKIQR